MIAAATTVLFVACEKEPTARERQVEYVCFASETQTIEVTPQTTKANIAVQAALNVPADQFVGWDTYYAVEVIKDASTAIAGTHYKLVEVDKDQIHMTDQSEMTGKIKVIGGDVDPTHLNLELIPENITEELTLTLRVGAFSSPKNPDPSKYTGFDLVKLTLKPKQ